MSQENVDAMRRVYEAMARGDFWAAREVFDPEIEWSWSSSMSGLTGVDTYHGIAGVEEATRDSFEAWDFSWQEAEKFIEAGDDVVVRVRQHGRPRGSTRDVEGEVGQVWTFRNGRVIRFKAFDTPAEAFEAVGLTEWAMSQENVEVVRRALTAFNRRDLDGFFEDSDSDVVWDWSRAVGPEVGIRRGRDEVARFINSWWDAFDESLVVIDDVIDARDQVVVVFHGRQRGRTSGAEVRGPGSVLVWTFRDGKAIEVTLYQTKDEALEAVGLTG